VFAIYSVYLRQQLSIMQQLGASVWTMSTFIVQLWALMNRLAHLTLAQEFYGIIDLCTVMQQLGASVFHMVVHWHKLNKMENECTLRNFVILASTCQKLSKLVKSWKSYNKNNFDCFYSETCCIWDQWLYVTHLMPAVDERHLADNGWQHELFTFRMHLYHY